VDSAQRRRAWIGMVVIINADAGSRQRNAQRDDAVAPPWQTAAMNEPRFVSARGLRFAYIEAGPSDGPLCLFVHGFPDTPKTWEHALPVAAKLGYRAVAPFTRGYAPTEIPTSEDYGSDTLGRDVLAIASALGADRFTLVGHDWGASAAYSAAGLEGARIERLVTVGLPHPASIAPSPRMLWTVRHFFTLRLPGAAARIRRGELKHLDELVQRWSPVWKVPSGETDAVKRSLGEPGSLEAALGYYRAITPTVPPGQRARIGCPTVAFAGTDDNVSVSAYEAARKRFTGHYDVVTMPGGHFMHREHPDVFARELERVLRRA
jgi:pimeloyl-ACP methyl ester carboxylesterase